MSDFRASGLPKPSPRPVAYQTVALQQLVETAPPPGPTAADLLAAELQRTQAALQPLFGALQEAAHALRQTREAFLADAPTQMAQVAMALAERVVERTAAVSPDVVLRCAERVLAEAMSGAAVRVAMHPEDAALLRAQLPDAFAALTAPESVTFAEDAALARGVIRAEAPEFRIDGGIPIRLGELWRAVMPDLPPGSDPA